MFSSNFFIVHLVTVLILSNSISAAMDEEPPFHLSKALKITSDSEDLLITSGNRTIDGPAETEEPSFSTWIDRKPTTATMKDLLLSEIRTTLWYLAREAVTI